MKRKGCGKNRSLFLISLPNFKFQNIKPLNDDVPDG